MVKLNLAITAVLATITQAHRLAQTFQSDTTHTCSTAMDRLKGTNVDWDTLKSSTTRWNDPDFPKGDALYWKDQGEQNDYGFG